MGETLPLYPMLTADEARSRYWKKTITWVLALIALWFLVSLGCGVLWVDQLDQYIFPGTGMKLGFWFAQQGSILIFLAILATFVIVMNRLDKELAEAISETRKTKEAGK